MIWVDSWPILLCIPEQIVRRCVRNCVWAIRGKKKEKKKHLCDVDKKKRITTVKITFRHIKLPYMFTLQRNRF